MNDKINDKEKLPLPVTDVSLARYARNLGTIGADGQKKLFSTKVIIAGLGGLGGYVADVLVRLGVGKVIGIDYDSFSEGVESKLGTPSFTPPVAAGIMVAEGVKTLLGENHKESFLIFFDLLNVEFQRLNL
ncbi:MAG TPA: hypothetical protein ENG51_15740 [Deltaproteobacteria bacterium]|nr:hypothetical protein [Deltaproteobacteria bacterium]